MLTMRFSIFLEHCGEFTAGDQQNCLALRPRRAMHCCLQHGLVFLHTGTRANILHTLA